MFFITNRAAYGVFGSGIRTRHIRRMFSPFSSKARSLNHSAILLPKKMWSMPAIVTTGRVFHCQPPSLWSFLREQDFDPTHIRRIFSLFSAMRLRALTTRPSCPQNVVYASHSNDGTYFSSPSAQPVDFFGSMIRTSAYPAYI